MGIGPKKEDVSEQESVEEDDTAALLRFLESPFFPFLMVLEDVAIVGFGLIGGEEEAT